MIPTFANGGVHTALTPSHTMRTLVRNARILRCTKTSYTRRPLGHEASFLSAWTSLSGASRRRRPLIK